MSKTDHFWQIYNSINFVFFLNINMDQYEEKQKQNPTSGYKVF
jgi:hypothetical protein